MANILDTIIATKHKEIELLKEKGTAFFEQQDFFKRNSISLKEKLKAKNEIHLITEFKRKSPSKGIINNQVTVQDITSIYQENNVAAISILTDFQYFGGYNDDIITVRNKITTPILRKEFIIDAIQLLEAKAIGADIILLIAACLSPIQVKQLATTAKKLGLEVLLEIHDATEQEHICPAVDFVGINNRNLKNFVVNLEHSIQLRQLIGAEFFAIAESGMQSKQDVAILKENGFDAFLIGEYLMKQENIGKAIQELKSIV